jgi:hypothetical protein
MIFNQNHQPVIFREKNTTKMANQLNMSTTDPTPTDSPTFICESTRPGAGTRPGAVVRTHASSLTQEDSKSDPVNRVEKKV